MTRKPNLALNAEIESMAERLTLPAVLVHFFRFALSDKLERLLQQQRSRGQP